MHAQLYIANTIHTNGVPDELKEQSADVVHIISSSFGIADARSLQTQAYLRPTTATHRQFLISFSSITREAQNALLKLLEEPPETAQFHIVVPRSDILIPTVRSRLMVMYDEQDPIERDTVRLFLKMNLGERMTEITARTKVKDVSWMEAILAGIEEYAHCQKGVMKQSVLEEVIFAREYFDERGSSKKMLLESIALVLPVVK